MNYLEAPNDYSSLPHPWIFFAGSIAMGEAEYWQNELADKLINNNLIGTIINPRRDDWDNTWKQSINDPRFNQQVNWELEAQEQADIILFYFAPDTQAPISLLELGLAAHGRKNQLILVCCPEDFYRRGNIEILCKKYNIVLCNSLHTLFILINIEL